MYPEDGDMAKANGRRVVKFGPVKDWKIVYSNNGAQVGAQAQPRTHSHMSTLADIPMHVPRLLD